MTIVKPRISRDVIAGSGYVCRSLQPGLSWHPNGSASICAAGDTLADAYNGWVKALKERQERYAKFIAEVLRPGEKP